jgi:hypothetical protein
VAPAEQAAPRATDDAAVRIVSKSKEAAQGSAVRAKQQALSMSEAQSGAAAAATPASRVEVSKTVQQGTVASRMAAFQAKVGRCACCVHRLLTICTC